MRIRPCGAAELLSYAPNLEIRGFAAVAPPANFRGSTNKVFQSGTGSGFYLAMRLYTWQTYYAMDTGAVFREPYASQAEGWFEKECQYDGATGKEGTLPSHFPADPNHRLLHHILRLRLGQSRFLSREKN